MATMTHRQDQELARRAAQGDEGAWRAIYDETCQPLFNFLCFQAGDRELARDLLQETYLKALRHLDGYRGQGSLLSWLRGIALRLCLDWRRGLGRPAGCGHANLPLRPGRDIQRRGPGRGGAARALR